ncbi:hypothetical protein PHLCEN_2v4766 [Hermanssonia centrifuga]|uniref:XRRM domain-containing protein n=1 Tax=Hermanssonia centrifuga TaxID=98765 RepID=A0A2R6PJC4_9APHY|nr:hypothetical protein PHLCEN_2v4766 [Hermanssonia centrifuga]
MFPFVPRKVTTKSLNAKATSAVTQQTKATPHHLLAPDVQEPTRTRTDKGKAKETSSGPSDEDYAGLLSLSLSDYTLWSDPDLRRTIECTEEQSPPESTLLKSIRTYLSDRLEVRVLMSSPSRSTWYGKQLSPFKNVGGYEVRLKNWEDTLRRVGNSTRSEWESRTVYMENIPTQFRSIPGIRRFALALFGASDSSPTEERVQHIVLPPHHQDKPEDQPKCKGFALVTCAQQADADYILQEWPWRRQRSATMEDIKADWSSEAHDAVKFGFHAMRKSEWEELNAEYLSYRQKLLDDVAGEEIEQSISVHENSIHIPETPPPKREIAPIPVIMDLDLSAPYPQNCLVYVRNVHTETNKTTLRKLFTHAFGGNNVQNQNESIDYVDFNKGMDTCYLRLAAPHHTTVLVSHFSNNATSQTQGLDGTGSPPAAGSKTITMEVVSGEREELYWGKVPEKVRRQAVEKAFAGGKPGGSIESEGKRKMDGGKAEGPRRKRRRG